MKLRVLSVHYIVTYWIISHEVVHETNCVQQVCNGSALISFTTAVQLYSNCGQKCVQVYFANCLNHTICEVC